MYCRSCGKEIPDDSVFCPFCGAAQNPQGYTQAGPYGPAGAYCPPPGQPYYSQQPYGQYPPAQEPSRKNGYGIAGFVLSILGVLGCLLYAVLGLIFSCIGMKKRAEFNSCNTLAKAGMIISIVGIAIHVVTFITEVILLATGLLDGFSIGFLL